MAQLAYRMEMLDEEQAGTHDPFGGHGIRLQFGTGTTREKAMEIIADHLGVPCTAGNGWAWADLTGSALEPEAALELWKKAIP